jgi:hypothetical protein
MAFDVHILAFNVTGVPYALQEAGMLVNRKRHDVIGEVIDLLVCNGSLRRRVIARQRQRLTEFAPATVAECLRRHVNEILRLLQPS